MDFLKYYADFTTISVAWIAGKKNCSLICLLPLFFTLLFHIRSCVVFMTANYLLEGYVPKGKCPS